MNVEAVMMALEAGLSELSPRHRVAFSAASAQRAARAFLDRAARRARDRAFFEETLNALWAEAAGESVGDFGGRVRRLAAFPEIASDEEAEGVAFYAECAVVALYYATEVATGDPDGVRNTVLRDHDMMDNLDFELDLEEVNLGRVVELQRRTLESLRGAVPLTADAVAALRERSVAEGDEFASRLAELS